VRSTSAKWAWVEYVLATGRRPRGARPLDAAVKAGGTFADYKRAFAAIPADSPRRKLAIVKETSSSSCSVPSLAP
jgi:uncharacterized protein (UPF0548 family)